MNREERRRKKKKKSSNASLGVKLKARRKMSKEDRKQEHEAPMMTEVRHMTEKIKEINKIELPKMNVELPKIDAQLPKIDKINTVEFDTDSFKQLGKTLKERLEEQNEQ